MREIEDLPVVSSLSFIRAPDAVRILVNCVLLAAHHNFFLSHHKHLARQNLCPQERR